ncbi:MAG: copper resistance protein CopC [Actinomycetota bacterium]|nr:copper resistance protein CopC [Actinomycetota bacterium]
MGTNERDRSRATTIVLLFVLAMALTPVTALAHGDLQSTIPEAGSKSKKPLDHIIINFTEPPTNNSVVRVKDGCDRQIVEELDFEDKAAHVYLSKGQPGKWRVSYDVVSAVDGHKSDGSYSLTVAGKADCSQKSNGNGGRADPADEATGPGPQAGGGGGEDESSFPVVPVALGSVGVIALALLARRLSG